MNKSLIGSELKRRVRIRRGQTLHLQQLPKSLKKTESRYIDLSNNVLIKHTRSNTYDKENILLKSYNTDVSHFQSSIVTPKNTSQHQTLTEFCYRTSVSQRSKKYDSFDKKATQVAEKAECLLEKSQSIRIQISNQLDIECRTEESDQEGSKGMYYGEFKRGCAEGRGILQKGDKIIFEGVWKKGKYHGQGMQNNISYDHNKQIQQIINIQQALFEKRFCVQDWKHYKGNFEMGKKHDKGVLIIAGDYQIHGRFKSNYLEGQIKLINKYNTFLLCQYLTNPILIKQ